MWVFYAALQKRTFIEMLILLFLCKAVTDAIKDTVH